MEIERNRARGWAIAGATFIGASVPTTLLGVTLGNQGIVVSVPLENLFFVGRLNVLAAWALICAPGAFVLGALLFQMCRDVLHIGNNSKRGVMIFGALSGGLLAIFNLPMNVLSAEVLSPREHEWIYVILLIVASGASSGAWIAWQAWRSVHPEEKFWPRFSLGTLLIVVIAWGALLAVFAPK